MFKVKVHLKCTIFGPFGSSDLQIVHYYAKVESSFTREFVWISKSPLYVRVQITRSYNVNIPDGNN